MTNGATSHGKAGRLLSKEEKERVRKAIEGAESVEEVSWCCVVKLRLARLLAVSQSDDEHASCERGADLATISSLQIRRLQRMLQQGFVCVLVFVSTVLLRKLTLVIASQANGEGPTRLVEEEGIAECHYSSKWGGDGDRLIDVSECSDVRALARGECRLRRAGTGDKRLHWSRTCIISCVIPR